MRLPSIDIFRAITMVCMVWVNDFWTLTNIPKWLQHALPNEDYLGFSDIIFPIFLFIVGLSIPFALETKLKKGIGRFSIIKHILFRTISLLLIGVYMVNYETANHESISIGKHFWGILMTCSIFLIWTESRNSFYKKRNSSFKLLGIILLFYLAAIYKGGNTGEQWMRLQWWGILGLIGWAYFINAILYLTYRGKYQMLFWFIVWLLFCFLSILKTQGYFSFTGPWKILSVICSGTIPAFTSAGVLTSLILKRNTKYKDKYYALLFVSGILTIVFGLLVRPVWGISKIKGTPSWVLISIGIAIISITLLHYYLNVRKKRIRWYHIIAPAGTSTLTCYTIPYFVYPLRNILGWKLPGFLNYSTVGLVGSFIFALLIVLFTGWLEKRHIKLKL